MTEIPIHLEEPPGAPGRYSRAPLPPYRHVPGLTPHPATDPSGHAYGIAEPSPSVACRELPDAWNRCAEYLYGVDLFNRAYLWEAHESWEVVWIAAGKDSDPARFTQGLIQTAAALLRWHLGTPRGARNLLRKAGTNFEPIENGLERGGREAYMGVALAAWRHAVAHFIDREGPYPFLKLESGQRG